ncbi:MAG: TetR/AcrR family transcriptional regulator [Nocardioidaceae bacterium]
MSELRGSGPRPRPRRADAERSIAAILDAATYVLAERSDASMDDIAAAAGISRQTIYAHFGSRDALVNALLDRVTRRVTDAIDAADLDTGSASAALVRFLEFGWQAFESNPFMLHLATPPAPPEQERDRHQPILAPLERLIARGQRAGEFDRTMPVSWLLAAIIGLGHAAGEEVRAERLTPDQAIDTLRRSIPRLLTPNQPNPPASGG